MTTDYYLSMGSLITGIVTNNPILTAVPTVFRLGATVYPKIYSLCFNKTFNEQELIKLEKIKSIVRTVAADLGINKTDKFSFQVSKQLGANACVLGTTNSLGGPFIVLGDKFFANFDTLSNENIADFVKKFDKITSETKSDFKEWVHWIDSLPVTPEEIKKYLDDRPQDSLKRFTELSKKFNPYASQEALFSKEELHSILAQRLNHNDYKEWLQLFDDIPNTPVELGRYLDECSENKKQRIAELSEKFKYVLSNKEMKSIIAHELGHAKHHHLLKFSGIQLVAFKSYDTMQSFIKYVASQGQPSYSEPLSFFRYAIPIAILPLAYIAIKAISRNEEIEADGECSGEYQEGMLKLHKKNLIAELLEVPTSSQAEKIKHMMQEIEWLSTHPNHAKRLAHAIQMDSTKLKKTSMSVTAKALSILGILSLAEVCITDSIKIFNWFNT
jgi:hypothetical protein